MVTDIIARGMAANASKEAVELTSQAIQTVKDWTKIFFSPFTLTEDGMLEIDMRSELVELDENGMLYICIGEGE